MKFIRILVFSLFLAPFGAHAAQGDFMLAAQLLAAAKSADIQQVQALVNNGADVNFVDATGLSIVCTALMNNDVRAAQILQMYGADASNCDRQIKQYNNRNKSKGSGGLFSGLSSAQSISLAAAGAAVVVGGLLLLTDVLDPGNDNESAGSGGDRPNNNPGGGENGGTAVAGLTVPYSPAYLGADGKLTSSDATYQANLLAWNPSEGGIREADFNYFRPTTQVDNNFVVDGVLVPVQNYLLMMHGYSAFANEYMGQEIFRDATTRNPVLVANSAGGGVPIRVGIVTSNGISATGSAARADGISYALSAAADATTSYVDKYFNYANPVAGVLGAELSGFDLSGSGTALNPFASAYDSALGKIIGGWEAGGRSYGDFMGFVPNAQLGILRTGGGQGWQDIANATEGAVLGTVSGTDNNIEVGDTLTLGGVTYQIKLATDGAAVQNPTVTVNGTTYRVPDGSTMLKGVCADTQECEDVSDIAIYVGTDGYYYVNTSGGNTVDAVYTVNQNNLYAQKELVDTDYKNFQALYNAKNVSDVLANVSVIEPSRSAGYLSVREMPALIALGSSTGATKTDVFQAKINGVYSPTTLTQGAAANLMFNGYGAGSPILVMPAGEFAFGDGEGKSLSALDATFENYAPALYDKNLEHLFMTVVAVGHSGQNGTSSAGSIGEYGNGVGETFGPLYLSAWTDFNGTLGDTSDDVNYMSRKCGVTGVGVNGVDPWCFAAAGATSEMATASAAGAVASLKAAFEYMSNSQIFTLMALTSDGYLLGADSAGNAFTTESLVAYLKSMYSLPQEYNVDEFDADEYLDAFAEVYGYGMINLERAMTPNKKIYFFDGNKIVSGNGNAYWRAAANTVFRPSAVLNVRGASVSAPFFDVLQNVDGSVAMPRVWENSFALGDDGRRGLYMGDVLGDFMTRRDAVDSVQIGQLNFEMNVSERDYADNLSGLDMMKIGFADDAWKLSASYQRYLTDGQSRFVGMGNPIMGLVSNAVVSDAEFSVGKWAFGARAFSGAITDEGLLENDPAISNQYMPAKLGLAQGGQSQIAWVGDGVKIAAAFGVMRETDTLLGAQTGGLLNLGNGNTNYVDLMAGYNFNDVIDVVARATFARTTSDANGDFVLGLDDINSNAFALGVKAGNFEFSVAQPLAITDGGLQYAHAEYDVVQKDGSYELNIVDTHVADIDLAPSRREVRFAGTYNHKFGEFTDGAFGFIYRVNPNHISEFGNETLLMMRLSHRLGI